MQQKSKPRNRRVVQAIVDTMTKEGRTDIVSDVLGSYTGTAAHGEAPEQDADDL